MSRFGAKVAYANAVLDREMTDPMAYVPMRERVNATAEPDPDRGAGPCRAILLQPGAALGSGWSGNAMHARASSEPTMWWMARGILADVRRFDRFTLTGSRHNPDLTGTHVYEIADGPLPYGFGRYYAKVQEIVGPDVVPAPPEATPPWED